MKFTLIPFLLLVLFPAYGQVLFERDSSGLEVQSQFSFHKQSTVIGIGPSLVLGGRIALGFAIGKEFAKDSDARSTAVRPSLGYIPIKQNDRIPFSIVTFLAYQDNSSKTEELNLSTFEYGIGIVPRISGDIDLFPGINFGWSQSQSKDANYNSREFKSMYFALDITLLFGKVYIDPLVAIRRDGTSFSIALGVLL
ncbi:MAG: hypothetical protein KDC80_30630 [Saprospiraceae bacterium]|nr:hypothetical protein [Saprospiraceae bacterium]